MMQGSTKHGWFWWASYAAAWVAVLALAVVALLRIFYHDGTHFLIQLNSFTRYVYLPAYACLIWASWKKRWILMVAALVVVVCHVRWMLPDFVRDRRFDLSADAAAGVDDSPTVRVFFSNVLGSKRDYSPLWKEIEDANPDVVVMAESSYFSVQSFLTYPPFAEFVKPNGSGRLRRGEVVVFSKLPITSESQTAATDRIVQTVDVAIGSQTLRVIGLHAPRPMPPPAYDYYGYWRQMVPFLAAGDLPRLIIGDFNATQHSLVYKRLKGSGLRSAHEDRGRGWATTWPNGEWNLPPIRIDQAFVSQDVECLGVWEGQGDGSDHRPLIVDVRLRQQL
jgi:endonuclease/exonuclease/phosphatase (EEP) superfamily protein YafD